jgi:hypothetical protein
VVEKRYISTNSYPRLQFHVTPALIHRDKFFGANFIAGLMREPKTDLKALEKENIEPMFVPRVQPRFLCHPTHIIFKMPSETSP